MEYLYRDCWGLPVRHQIQKVDDSLSWTHISKREIIIPLEAWEFKDKHPDQYPKEMGPTGAYLSLDSATDAVWFRKESPWGPFTPFHLGSEDAIDFSDFSAGEERRAICALEEATGYAMTQEWKERWTLDMDKIDRCCTALRDAALYPSKAPIPLVCPRMEFDKIHENLHMAEATVANIKCYALDGLAFLWYWTSTRRGWKNGVDKGVVEAVEHWITCLPAKRGVLVDLERDWPLIDIANWVANDIPIVFTWTPAIEANPHFERLSPRFLDTVWKVWDAAMDRVDYRSIPLTAIPDYQTLFPNVHNYDAFLQNPWQGYVTESNRGYKDYGEYDLHICDFEGWRKRLIVDTDSHHAYLRSFHSKVISTGGKRSIICWHFRPFSEEDKPSAMEVDTLSEDIHEIRQQFLHSHGPLAGMLYDKETGERRKDPSDRAETWPYMKGPYTASSTSRSSSSSSYRTPRTCSGPDRSSSERSAQRSGEDSGKRPALASRLSDNPRLSRTPSLSTRISNRTSSRSNAGLSTDRQGDRSSHINVAGQSWDPDMAGFWEDEARRERAADAFCAELADVYDHFFDEGSGYRVPTLHSWNTEFLGAAFLSLPDKETLVRAKLHHIVKGPFRTSADLLTWLVEQGLEFRLALTERELPQWTPHPISEADRMAGKYYSTPQSDLILTWDRGEAGFMEDYERIVSNLLLRPHARATVFAGGPLHWIAQRYRGEELIKEAMQGPSIQVTVHREGNLNISSGRMLRADSLSITERNALYGLLSSDRPEKDKTLWPTESILREYLDGYSGQWTAECEGLYRSIWGKIRTGGCTLRTRLQWKAYMRTSNRLGIQNTPLSYLDWDEMWWKILRSYLEIWDGSCLSDINFAEPFLSH
ncbi:hypothetical protein Hypma_005897 [Hypsizygus marmoreus]|uniref:Uncharacterized protein n=1 Tax=Hypsizygus marmoreus TaxID=39966 RepID=A0A369KIU6_HYPMA|nr:hypothetical protein Hypma_005897 [Hypsizygus marmoreus]